MWCIRVLVKVKNFLTSLCFEKEREPNMNIRVPWIWIGGKTKDDEIIDVTRRLSFYLNKGDIVSEAYLKQFEPSCNSWTYIDFMTLNEKKIPVGGIQI